MSSSRRLAWMVGTWMLILVIYSALSLLLKRSSDSLNTFGNIVQCIVPLLANAGLLLNAGTPHWRRNIFWMLLAMSCTLWMIGQFEWTYYEVYLHRPLPEMYPGDILFFLRGIPMMAAIALRPHLKRGDLQLLSAFLWFALAGVIAHQNQDRLDAPSENVYDSDSDSTSDQSVWPARLAMAAVISLPLFAIYTLRFSQDDAQVRDFRLMTTLLASVPLALLIFVRTHLADRDRSRLLSQSEQSVENLKRLQAQIVQSEKLVSLGQLAAGAAHEINNPLTAILGFSDLLVDDASIPEKARTTAAKIRDQARRTKTLVANLLSFARQAPSERTLLDINTVVTNAAQLRGLDLKGSTSIELRLESVLPGVRGDGNQLMQVFF